jgi:hypothetical protein
MGRLVTSAPALIFAAVVFAAGIWAVVHSIRGDYRTRRGIRRLQQYANHPGSRAILDDFHQPRKEKPQP